MTTSRNELHVLDAGTPTWCWLRLACSSEATLSCFTPEGRFSVDVSYRLGKEQIAIAVPSLTSVAWRAAGRVATLKITGTTHDHLRWSVRVAGHAYRAGDHLQPASAGESCGTSRPAWLSLSSLQVRGYHETITADNLAPDRSATSASLSA